MRVVLLFEGRVGPKSRDTLDGIRLHWVDGDLEKVISGDRGLGKAKVLGDWELSNVREGGNRKENGIDGIEGDLVGCLGIVRGLERTDVEIDEDVVARSLKVVHEGLVAV